MTDYMMRKDMLVMMWSYTYLGCTYHFTDCNMSDARTVHLFVCDFLTVFVFFKDLVVQTLVFIYESTKLLFPCFATLLAMLFITVGIGIGEKVSY